GTGQVVLRAAGAGEMLNRATGPADRGLKGQAEAPASFSAPEQAAGVHLDLVDEEGNQVEVGGTTRYAISVLNQGGAPLTKVQLVATVPDEMEVIATKPEAGRDGRKVTFPPFD